MEAHGPIVMVVDDDASVRSALARLFRTAGFAFQTFASAEEFLGGPGLASAACLVADVQMPGLRGLELQAICARKRPSLPIVMISAFEDAEAERQAIAAGAIAFLHKPFDGEALLAIVGQSIAVGR